MFRFYLNVDHFWRREIMEMGRTLKNTFSIPSECIMEVAFTYELDTNTKE
jgi:hypothetical protein